MCTIRYLVSDIQKQYFYEKELSASVDERYLQAIEGTQFESEGHFLAEIPLVKNRPIRNKLFYFETFGSFDRTLLQVIEGAESESEGHFFGRDFIGQEPANQK